ncbi:hypothetical protein A7U60_g3974 [Sanghuangporus baumii]|uniref:Uncharacterized protein n=1 Tax=Sanghuangporus baumii TaxID=108892 RepID=A0A9Q5NCQ8_SANBA|nr:hypothetical protein A7U60_g3974 [Sanghuangporus baumii]
MGNQDLSLVHFGLHRRVPNAKHLISGSKELSLMVTIPTALQGESLASITLFFYYCGRIHMVKAMDSRQGHLHSVEIYGSDFSHVRSICLIKTLEGLEIGCRLRLMGIGLLPIRWNDVGQPLINGKKLEILEIGACLGGYLYVVAGTVAIVLAEIILAMRIYAFAGTQGLGIAYTLKPEDSCIGKPCLLDSFLPFQVTVTCSMASEVISVLGWIPTSIVELIFLVLVFWKTRRARAIRGEYSLVAKGKVPYAVDIMAVLARDSKKYFLQIFALCFIGACLNVIVILDNLKLHSSSLAIVLSAVLSNTFVIFAVAVLSILAPELFISLRMEYYGPVGSLADQSQLPWEVAIPEGSQHAPQDSGSSRRGQYSIVEDQEAWIWRVALDEHVRLYFISYYMMLINVLLFGESKVLELFPWYKETISAGPSRLSF